MAGIEDLKDVVKCGGKLAVLVKELSDGVDLGDIDEAVAFVTTLPAAVDGIENVPDEIEDLDGAERAEIDELLNEFGIEDEKKNAAFKHFVHAGLHAGQGALILKD